MKMMDNVDTMQEKTVKETLRGVFGLNMSTVIVLSICGILIATAIFEPTKTGASVYEIVINSMSIFLSTMAINALLRDKSIRDAFAMQSVQLIVGNFGSRVKEVIENNEMEDLEKWCDEKNKANYENQRKRILASVGLEYKDFFKNGEYTGKEIYIPKIKEARQIGMWYFPRAWRMAVKQSKALASARYLRLSEISAQMLTTEGENANDQYRMGRDVHTFRKQTAKSQAKTKILIALIFGYYTSAIIANFSFLNLVIKIMQVAFALVMGAIDYLATTGYVINELMGRYTKKTRLIDQYHGTRKEVTKNSREVPRELGNPDHEGTGASPTDRELHAVTSANI